MQHVTHHGLGRPVQLVFGHLWHLYHSFDLYVESAFQIAQGQPLLHFVASVFSQDSLVVDSQYSHVVDDESKL